LVPPLARALSGL